MGIKIKDAQLTEQLKLEDKFPISNGSDGAASANIQQLKQLIIEGLVTQDEIEALMDVSMPLTRDFSDDFNNDFTR